MADEKITEEEFVFRAIDSLANEKYPGRIHVVYSGFNEAFRKYYGKDSDPRAAVERLVDEGKISKRPVKGGVVIWKGGMENPGKKALDAMGL